MAGMRLRVLFLFAPLVCLATDLEPWFGEEYEVEIRTIALYQYYDSIATPVHHRHTKPNNDAFVTLSAAYPFRRFCGEFEITGAYTRHQKCGWDNTRLTGRYQCWNEIEGAPSERSSRHHFYPTMQAFSGRYQLLS